MIFYPLPTQCINTILPEQRPPDDVFRGAPGRLDEVGGLLLESPPVPGDVTRWYRHNVGRSPFRRVFSEHDLSCRQFCPAKSSEGRNATERLGSREGRYSSIPGYVR